MTPSKTRYLTPIREAQAMRPGCERDGLRLASGG